MELYLVPPPVKDDIADERNHGHLLVERAWARDWLRRANNHPMTYDRPCRRSLDRQRGWPGCWVEHPGARRPTLATIGED